MQIDIEKWFESRYLKFPIIRDALIKFWKTIFTLTKFLTPQNIRYHKDDFQPLLYCDVGYEDPQYHNDIEGWNVKFHSGDYPENPENRKTMESAIINLLKKIPDIHVLTSSVNITPFLNLTPNLRLLSLSYCKSTKFLSPKIGFLNDLHILYFRGCIDLEQIPSEIDNLPNLREIKIEACHKLQTLPKSFNETSAAKIMTISPDPFDFPDLYPDLIIPSILRS